MNEYQMQTLLAYWITTKSRILMNEYQMWILLAYWITTKARILMNELLDDNKAKDTYEYVPDVEQPL